MYYPSDWSEFEDTESSFLFYNPNVWSGNFRISAFKKAPEEVDAPYYGKEAVKAELTSNKMASLVKVGKLECAYSKDIFQEEGTLFTNHSWITGIRNIAFECTFSVVNGESTEVAEKIIASLDIREDGKKYPAEMIPIRISEISMVNEGYELTASTVKKILKKDFQGMEADLPMIQKVIDSGHITPKQKDYWLAFGITLCVILTNEVEDMEWMTLIDGNREAPVLQYAVSGEIIDPLRLVWSKMKAGHPCNVVEEYRSIIENL